MSEGSKQSSAAIGGTADSYKFVDETKSPTNVAVGALASGSNIFGREVREVIEDAVWEYKAPSISSLTSTTSTNQICHNEIGTALTFNFTIANAANVKANTLKVTDITNGIVLASGQDHSGLSITVNLASAITKTSHYSSHVFQLEIEDTKGNFYTRNITFRWYMPMFYGKSDLPVLTELDLADLTQDNNEKDAALQVVYADSSPTIKYAYEIIHSSLSPISAGTDVAANVGWTFVNTANDANYNLTNVHGLNYYTLNVTVGTDNPTVEVYHVLRSLNAFAGAKTVSYAI